MGDLLTVIFNIHFIMIKRKTPTNSISIASLVLIISLCSYGELIAQPQLAKPDSLRSALRLTTNDTLKIVILTKLTEYYSETNPDSSFAYANELARVANRLSYKLDEASAQLMMGYALLNKRNYPRS